MKKVITDMIPVILGVLIALLLNNWREDFQNRKFVEKSLVVIRQDIKESKESIAGVLKKHEALIDSIALYLEDDEKSIRVIAGGSGGVQYPFSKNIALRFFIASRAELIDYKTISLLTEMEASKDLMDQKFEKLMDFAYEKLDASDQKSKYAFATHLANVMDSETTLLELYDEYLETENPKE